MRSPQAAPGVLELAVRDYLRHLHPGCYCLSAHFPEPHTHTPARETGSQKLGPRSCRPIPCSAEWVTLSESHPVGGRSPLVPFLLRGLSQFPDSPVGSADVALWAAVWGREAGQMSRSPGEEAAPRGGQAGPQAW